MSSGDSRIPVEDSRGHGSRITSPPLSALRRDVRRLMDECDRLAMQVAVVRMHAAVSTMTASVGRLGIEKKG